MAKSRSVGVRSRKKIERAQEKRDDFCTASLEEFYAVLAAIDRFDHIPDIHFRFMAFLKDYHNWGNGTGILQAFRNSAKSSVSAAFIVWLLAKDPTTIIVIQSADDITAQRTIEDCKRIITLHPMAAHLRSPNNVWTARGFRVKGATSGRNLSLSARGIFSNVTGGRADWIIYDDVEVPKNAGSAELREKLRGRISEAAHLLNPGGKRLFIGTPHSDESIYPEIIDDQGATSLRIPLFKGEMEGSFPFYTGETSWPERWTAEEVAIKQSRCKSRAEFLSQYQLIPRSSEEATLDPTLLKTYTAKIEVVESNKSMVRMLNKIALTNVSAFWDPSRGFGRDGSVLAIVYQDDEGKYYIDKVLEVKGDAEQQCIWIRDLLVEYRIGAITVETNGVGAFLPETLRKYTRGLDIAVDEQHTKKKKVVSIVEAFETPMSAGFMYVHEEVLASPFLSQMRDFPRSKKDDFIDAPAKAIHLLPILYGRNNWNSIEGWSAINNNAGSYEIEREYALS